MDLEYFFVSLRCTSECLRKLQGQKINVVCMYVCESSLLTYCSNLLINMREIFQICVLCALKKTVVMVETSPINFVSRMLIKR